MDTNVVICLLVGLPGVGKTSLADTLIANSLSEVKPRLKVLKVSFDDFLSLEKQEYLVRESMSTPEQKLFKCARELFAETVFNLVSDIKSRVDNIYLNCSTDSKDCKYLLILDDNFYYKSMRYKFFQIASRLNCGFCQMYAVCPLELVLERNRSRANSVSREVIEIMNSRMEPPSPSNFWEKASLAVDTGKGNYSLTEIFEFVSRNFKNGLSVRSCDEEQKIASQEVNFKSLVHRADLILRSLVGEILSKSRKEKVLKNPKELSSVVNDVRQKILSRLKDGDLLPPASVVESSGINETVLYAFLKENFEEGLVEFSLFL